MKIEYPIIIKDVLPTSTFFLYEMNLNMLVGVFIIIQKILIEKIKEYLGN